MCTYNVSVLRQRMLSHLNGKISDYPYQTEQRFPRILARLVDVWGQPDGEAYLSDLLVNKRPNRKGFPDDVAGELFRLSMIHSALLPDTAMTTSGWLSSDDTDIEGSSLRRFDR
jgi:hypothetical protein